MTTHPFAKPFVVFVRRSTVPNVLRTVAQASNFLFHHWADNDSAAWSHAMNECHHAEAGIGTTEAAEMAVFAALRVAGMQMEQLAAFG